MRLAFGTIGILLFSAGYVTTCGAFTQFTFEYLALTLISMLSCLVVVSTLDRPPISLLPALLGLSLFYLFYYLEFYQLVLSPSLMSFVPLYPATYEHSAEVFLSVYMLVTLGFTGFSLGTWLCYAKWPRAVWQRRVDGWLASRDRGIARMPTSGAALAALFCALLTALVCYAIIQFNMVMGAGVEPAPYFINGLVFYGRGITIPMLSLFVIMLGSRKSERWEHLGIAFLIGFSVLITLLTATKGALVWGALQLWTLRFLLSRGKMGYRDLALPAALGGAGCALFTVVAAFRAAHIGGLAVTNALAAAYNASRQSGSLLELYGSILGRLGGANVLLVMLERRVRPLYSRLPQAVSGSKGLAGYIDQNVFGLDPVSTRYLSLQPSFVGLFYLIAGGVGVFGGILLFWLIIGWLWSVMSSSRLRSAPVVQVGFLTLILPTLVDGGYAAFVWKVQAVFLASILLVELCSRARPLGPARHLSRKAES